MLCLLVLELQLLVLFINKSYSNVRLLQIRWSYCLLPPSTDSVVHHQLICTTFNRSASVTWSVQQIRVQVFLWDLYGSRHSGFTSTVKIWQWPSVKLIALFRSGSSWFLQSVTTNYRWEFFLPSLFSFVVYVATHWLPVCEFVRAWRWWIRWQWLIDSVNQKH